MDRQAMVTKVNNFIFKTIEYDSVTLIFFSLGQRGDPGMRQKSKVKIFRTYHALFLGDNAPTPVDPVPYGRLRGAYISSNDFFSLILRNFTSTQ